MRGPLSMLMLAATLSMLIIPLLWRIAPRFGLVDLPDARKVHTAPVPRVGGWGITLGCLLPLLLWSEADRLLQSFAIGVAILFAFGVWDDVRQIGHWTKFLGQLLAASVVVYWGGLYIDRVPFLDAGLGPAIGKPFSMFALVGVINAINHSDGLDGLAAGESMLSLIALAVLGYFSDSSLIVGTALSVVGGILGFLRYNSHPARVFMGDSGSQVLGFALGFLTIYLTQIGDTALSAALPLLILGVPVADILAVLYQRATGGMNWFKATRNHVHHRLLDLGFRHYQTVVIIYSVQALLATAAVLLRYESDTLIAALYLFVVLGLFAALAIAERTGWRLTARQGSRIDDWSNAALYARRKAVLRDSPRILLSVAVPAFMLLGALAVHRVPRDVSLVAALLAAVVATEMGRARAVGSGLVRLAVYVAAVASVYLIVTQGGSGEGPMQIATLVIVVALALAIGAYLRFAADREFGTTPTDYLILFVVLALLVFGSLDIGVRTLAEVVVCAIVLLYGCEVLIGLTSRRWNALHLSTLAALAIMALRGAL
jgi:UDP-GlcNAc:undecaprenyl-phosphate/decaprenyl-phosphate GlcNAc-1-phosphate transferase